MYKMMQKHKILDLFCGCGGFSYGFKSAGYNIIAGVDISKDDLYTFEKNIPGSLGINMDLSNFNVNHLYNIIGDVSIVLSGPPCQGFSISGKRNPSDARNSLYQAVIETIKKFHPNVFILENVPHLLSMGGGVIKNMIISDFSSLDYSLNYQILLASDYGVPQNRKRVFFVGIKNNSKFIFPPAQNILSSSKITCFEAISDLPEDSVLDGSENLHSIESEYQNTMRRNTNKIYNHQTTKHDQKTIDIISLVPDGGNYRDLPVDLQSTRKVHIAWTRFNSKKPSFTIDTGHRHHFHYKYNRIPTVRECARLQSFPDDFIFYGSKTSQYKQVGNAVPPLIAMKIAQKIFEVF